MLTDAQESNLHIVSSLNTDRELTDDRCPGIQIPLSENSKRCTMAESGLWRGDPGTGGVPADPAGAQHQVPALLFIT